MSRDEVALSLLRVVLLAFALGGIWILAARALGLLRGPRILIIYATEPLVLGALLVPAYLGGASFTVAIAALLAVSGVELLSVLRREGMNPTRAIGGALYLVAGCASLVALERLGAGFGNVVFCFSLTEISDSLAYLAGNSFGRARPWPRLSPNKTWAGCVVGLGGCVGAAPFFRFAIPALTLSESLAAGVLLAVGGQAGDLLASSFKRAAGVKDYAGWVPVHGGVLDVYDAVLFAAPVFLAYLVFVGHGIL
jgi:phosphatidate cytidylyltransferase